MKQLLAGVLLLLSGTVSAAVIEQQDTLDFDEYPGGWGESGLVATKGYQFTSNAVFLIAGPGGNADPAKMLGYCPGCEAELTRIGGNTFRLSSLDLVSAFPDPASSTSITITGTYFNGSTVSHVLSMGHAVTNHILDPYDWDNLVSVTFGATDNNHVFDFAFIDNLVVTAVPVPAAVWLFGSALGFLGLRRSNNKRKLI